VSHKRKYDFSTRRGQPETTLFGSIDREDLAPWEIDMLARNESASLGQYEKAKPVESDATLRRLDFFVHKDDIARHERITYDTNPLVGDPAPTYTGELDLFGNPLSPQGKQATIDAKTVTVGRMPDMSIDDDTFVVGLVNGSAGNMRDLSAKEKPLPFMPTGDLGYRKNANLHYVEPTPAKKPSVHVPDYVYQQGIAVMVDYIMHK
jgi:hypothetical protein